MEQIGRHGERKGGIMSFDLVQMVRVAKRMRQATGYLELGMGLQARERLDSVGTLGPFEAEADLLRGTALQMEHRYDDAATSFQNAVLKFPSPQDKAAWLALSECYRQVGDVERAVESLANARGAKPHSAGQKAE